MFCKENYRERDKLMRNIAQMLMGFTRSQLELLLKIGFCLDESVVTFPLEPSNSSPTAKFLKTFPYFNGNGSDTPSFKVCHGHTAPDNLHVNHHVPTPEEIYRQTIVLQKMLSLLPKPNSVTVCR